MLSTVSFPSYIKEAIANKLAVPWVANVFLKLITPFIDPITREKLHFNEDVSKYVPKEQLWTELGGDVQFEYDHATYWPTLTALCNERSSERKARWKKAGKVIGESEVYLRGGNAPSVGKAADPAVAPAPALAAGPVTEPAAAAVAISAEPTAQPAVAPVAAPTEQAAQPSVAPFAEPAAPAVEPVAQVQVDGPGNVAPAEAGETTVAAATEPAAVPASVENQKPE